MSMFLLEKDAPFAESGTDGLTHVTLFMLDVDASGDEVERALGRAFPSASVTRQVGGEIAVLLSDCGEAEVALRAERLLHAVRRLGLRVSVGAAVAAEKETAAELVERARHALERSKRAGRNRWCAASSRVH
jgi:GGDEF domain-containing protein